MSAVSPFVTKTKVKGNAVKTQIRKFWHPEVSPPEVGRVMENFNTEWKELINECSLISCHFSEWNPHSQVLASFLLLFLSFPTPFFSSSLSALSIPLHGNCKCLLLTCLMRNCPDSTYYCLVMLFSYRRFFSMLFKHLGSNITWT